MFTRHNFFEISEDIQVGLQFVKKMFFSWFLFSAQTFALETKILLSLFQSVKGFIIKQKFARKSQKSTKKKLTFWQTEKNEIKIWMYAGTKKYQLSFDTLFA